MIKSNIITSFLAILYLSLILILMQYFMGDYNIVILSDFTAYVIIGERYANADWTKAINAAWAPGISWILAIGFKAGISKASIGICWLYFQSAILAFTCFMIVHTYVVRRMHRIVWLLVCAPGIVYFSLMYPSADIVVGCIYLYFFSYLNSVVLNNTWSIKEAIFLGLTASVAYLFKYFSLPFCIILTSTFLIFYIYNHRYLLKNCVKFYAVFLISTVFFVSPWIILLSNKYNQFTLSTSQLYPHIFNHPDYIGVKLEEVSGLIAPPYADSPTSWEDPTYYPYPKWSPLENWSMFKHGLNRFCLNFSIAIRYGIGYCTFLAWFIIAFAIRSIYKKEQYYNLQCIILFAMLINAIGYSMYLFDERHSIWFFFSLVWLVILSYKPDRIVLSLWVWFAAIVFIRMPVINYRIYSHINKENKDVSDAINEIPESMIKGKRIATNFDDWAMNLAWRRNAYCYGFPSPESALEDCQKYKIDLYVKFPGRKKNDLNLKTKIWESKNHTLEIYKLY